jgi:tetratricopeptide (TPR) repeat protein
MGTPAYMSPEQLRGEEVDARTDLFSLGVVCHELIAGTRPFDGDTHNHLVVAIFDEEPAPLTHQGAAVSAELQAVVSKALRKSREARWQSAAEFLQALKTLPQPTEPPRRTVHTPAVAHQATAPALAAITQAGAAVPTLASLKAARSQAKFYRRAALLALLALIAVSAAAAYFYARRPVMLTERDTVLLADFTNLTGEDIFDHTLKQALAVELEQTPFLNFFPEDRVRETLRYMGRQPNERVTKELAREIGQRQGLKAVLTGTLARFERRYAVTLTAVSSQTGATIASAMAEADDKDQVLRALGAAATDLRQRLGESLASIQTFAAPLEQATTTSLAAFQAWARGVEQAQSGKPLEAIPFYKHARELDPHFARAEVSLSLVYGGAGQLELAAEHATKAYGLRERVTERERLDIIGTYHTLATGALHEALEVFKLRAQTYPRDHGAHARLAYVHRLLGDAETSLAVARQAHQLNPRAAAPHVRIWTALILLNRFDEARAEIERALAQPIAVPVARGDLYQLAVLANDATLMQKQVDAISQTPDEYLAWHWQAQSAALAGRLKQADELDRRAAARAQLRHAERAAWLAEEALLRGAVCGICRPVKRAPELLSLHVSAQLYVPVVASRALALALCHETSRARALADAMKKSNPQATLAQSLWLPVVGAAIALSRHDAAQAVRLLQPTSAYERAALFWPNYLRGVAYVRLGSGEEAKAEFQKILAHRGWDVLSPLTPLARLGLARATALTGEKEASVKAYQEFLSAWQTADTDLPPLLAARREMEQTRPTAFASVAH